MTPPLTGQLTVSGSIQQIATANPSAYSIKASSSNTAAVFVGPSTVTNANGFRLDPGETLDVEKRSFNGQPAYQTALSEWYLAAGTDTTDVVTWVGFP